MPVKITERLAVAAQYLRKVQDGHTSARACLKVKGFRRMLDADFRGAMNKTLSGYAVEKQVEWDIIKNLKTLGFRVSKLSQPRSTMQSEGLPDLYVTHAGWQLRWWIEVKSKRRVAGKDGGLSPAQREWHNEEIRAGGTVIIASEIDDVMSILRDLGHLE